MVTLEERFLILAPGGRDAPFMARTLRRAHLDAVICPSMDAACDEVELGAGGLLLTDEALDSGSVWRLGRVLAAQPTWSDLPVLLCTGAGAGSSTNGVRPPLDLAALGNVILIDRPIRTITLVTAARFALRARRRQYGARGELDARRQTSVQRDQFLAMLGHELRNPLSVILFAIDMLERHEGARTRHSEIVRRQTMNLARLVDDLLDVSRVTSGKIVLQRAPVDLSELIERCLEGAAARAEERRLQVSFRRAGPRPVIDGDAVRLEQVFMNLIGNAVKYTPHEGRIDVELEHGGREAVVRVRDTGVGIAPDVLPRVFDLFMQGDGGIDRAQGGLGVGLTLVRSLVLLHGGTVDVSSVVGAGSEFTVRLPLRDRAAVVMVPVAPPGPPPVTRNVLVVEDNPDSRELLREALAEFGHRVEVARDGAEGVERAIELAPDVVLVDIGLPRLDGYEVARRIRARLGRDIFLVALTGYGQPDDKRMALEAGFDVHCTKPFDVERLVATFQRGK